MKKQQDRKFGFGTVEFILILVIVGILGLVGWYVWNMNNVKSSSNSSTDSSTPSIDAVAKDVTNEQPAKYNPISGWLMYTSQNSKYSIDIPDGWNLTSHKEDDDIIAWDAKDIKLTPGIKANVTTLEGGRGGASVAFFLIFDYDVNEKSFQSTDLKKVKTYTTTNQIEVTKFSRTHTTEQEGMDIPKGTTEYVYDLLYKGKNIHIVHHVLLGEADQSKLVEQMIETVIFL